MSLIGFFTTWELFLMNRRDDYIVNDIQWLCKSCFVKNQYIVCSVSSFIQTNFNYLDNYNHILKYHECQFQFSTNIIYLLVSKSSEWYLSSFFFYSSLTEMKVNYIYILNLHDKYRTYTVFVSLFIQDFFEYCCLTVLYSITFIHSFFLQIYRFIEIKPKTQYSNLNILLTGRINLFLILRPNLYNNISIFSVFIKYHKQLHI